MLLRPLDSSGDVLPVADPSALLSGPPAVALLADLRLNLFAGDWWENPAWGNPALQLLQQSRPTLQDARTLSAALSSYVRDTPGVLDVRDETWTLQGPAFTWSCTLLTAAGPTTVSAALSL